jgi:ferredoxin, 2Fe-2S
MPIEITFVAQDGSTTTIHAAPRRSLMQAAVAAGIEGIAADCGGTLSCATCHVLFDPTQLECVGEPAADEAAMLEMTASPREPGSRLSCQITVGEEHQGLVVRLPATQY